MSLSRIRLLLWGIVGVAAFALGGLSLWSSMKPSQQATVAGAPGTSAPASGTGLIPPNDQIGGPFALVNTDGVATTQNDFKGKPTAIFFGFTHCPDVCPTTLAEATGWLEALGPNADKLRFVFVSVDPERDTVEVLKNYLSPFDGRIVGLTGGREAVDAAIKAYRVYARKVPLKDGDYTMDHTAGVYLMNADMRFVGLLNYQEPTDKALVKLKALIGS